MRALLQQALDALECQVYQPPSVADAIAALKQALAQESVVKDSFTTEQPFKPDWASYRQGKADGIAEAQESKPLSDKQIYRMHEESRLSILAFARAIEQAHGINKQP